MTQQTKEQKVKQASPNAECITSTKNRRTIYVIRDKVSLEILGEGCNSVVAWFNAYNCMTLETA